VGWSCRWQSPPPLAAAPSLSPQPCISASPFSGPLGPVFTNLSTGTKFPGHSMDASKASDFSFYIDRRARSRNGGLEENLAAGSQFTHYRGSLGLTRTGCEDATTPRRPVAFAF
jgi:hypothetical protein